MHLFIFRLSSRTLEICELVMSRPTTCHALDSLSSVTPLEMYRKVVTYTKVIENVLLLYAVNKYQQAMDIINVLVSLSPRTVW